MIRQDGRDEPSQPDGCLIKSLSREARRLSIPVVSCSVVEDSETSFGSWKIWSSSRCMRDKEDGRAGVKGRKDGLKWDDCVLPLTTDGSEPKGGDVHDVDVGYGGLVQISTQPVNANN